MIGSRDECGDLVAGNDGGRPRPSRVRQPFKTAFPCVWTCRYRFFALSRAGMTASPALGLGPGLDLLLCNIAPHQINPPRIEKSGRDLRRFHLVKSVQSAQIAAVRLKSGPRASGE